MNRKKMMPLFLLAVCVVVLAVVLAVLRLSSSEEEPQGIPLCAFEIDTIDKVSYSGNNVEVTLLKGSEGNWMMESDPTLPLDQDVVADLIQRYGELTAQRKLENEDLTGLPERTETPLMVFEIASGDTVCTLTVDQANDVADIYYVYDEVGTVYTVNQVDLAGICKEPRDLYKPQTLTDKTVDDITAMQVGELTFTRTDGVWTLSDDAEWPLNQDAVEKMANTVCGVQTDWTITSPEEDGCYGLETPDVTATVKFSDGTDLTVKFGDLTPDDDGLCYLVSDGAPTVVYEVSADYKAAFAVTKETLLDTTATAETAEEAADTIIAEHPVGGWDDYADSGETES